jgi:hypothetical protein
VREDQAVSDLQPSHEDYQSVLDAGRRLHEAGWRRAYTVNEQLAAWQGLVEQVERGEYTWTIDDYTNDLAVRTWLELARPILTEAVRGRLDDELGPLDQRFRRATFKPARHPPGCSDEWWCRLPTALGGELAEDVERMDLRP